jgi:hypothetical protein
VEHVRNKTRDNGNKLLSTWIQNQTKRKLCANLTAIKEEAQNIHDSVKGV